MKWFRSNLRIGSRLALLSLLIQFAFSFGHFHSLTAHASTPTGLVQSHATYASILSEAEATGREAKQQPASDHDSGRSSSDGCAICASIALANTVLLATPPSLPLPRPAELAFQATDTEFVYLNSAGVAFQPRAPPVPCSSLG
jgi:DUF2946 family protein